jgi:hypothetical protein
MSQLDHLFASGAACVRSAATATKHHDDDDRGHDETDRSEHGDAGSSPEPNRDKQPDDRSRTTDSAGGGTNTNEGEVLLLAAQDAAPNSECTIGSASAGARISSARPRVSTVIVNRKNWQQSCSAVERPIN